MTNEDFVYEWGSFVITRTKQPADPFAVLYRDESRESSVLRTASTDGLRRLIQHLEEEPREGEVAAALLHLRNKIDSKPSTD